MKTRYIFILFVIFSFGTFGVAQQKSGCQPRSREYSSPDGRFKVCFPGVPEEMDLPYDTKMGPIVSHSVVYGTDVFYSVTYIDYPVESVTPDAVKKFLEVARNGGLAQLAPQDPHVTAESDITEQGYPGRYLRIELKGDAILRQKILLAGNRMYIFGVGTPKAAKSQATYETLANSFFDSFKIVPPLAADLAATWKEFSSTEGKFKVQFPGIPYESSAVGVGRSGSTMHTTAYQSSVYFTVSYVDDPQMPNDPAALKTYLDNQRRGESEWLERQGVKSTVLKETDITIGGYPGRYLEMELSTGDIYRRKTVIVKNRFFGIDAISPKTDTPDGSAYEKLSMRFLNSFSLLGP